MTRAWWHRWVYRHRVSYYPLEKRYHCWDCSGYGGWSGKSLTQWRRGEPWI